MPTDSLIDGGCVTQAEFLLNWPINSFSTSIDTAIRATDYSTTNSQRFRTSVTRRRAFIPSHEYILWICLAAYSIHILEEYELNWRDWARRILGLGADWTSFYIVNSIVVVLGICCAAVGWRQPCFALDFPALMLVNATLFHVFPTVIKRVYSPGLATALVLFYPIVAWTYYGAWKDGMLSAASIIGSLALGSVLMATPIVLLKIKDRPAFKYD
jgi:hypothetical protein